MEETAVRQAEETQHVTPDLGVLCDPSRMWRVREGAVDLFLVRVEEGLPAGARRPVTRVTAGDVILSPCSNGGFAFFGQRTPGTRLERIGWHALTEADLARWIERLGATLGTMPPASFVTLESDQPMEISEGTAIYSPDGLMWVTHMAGASRLLGWPSLDPVHRSTPFPICRCTWLVAEDGAKLRRIEPGGDAVLDGIDEFHRHVLAAMVERTREQDSRFSARVRSRAQSDQANVQVARRALATVLEAGPVAAPSGGTGDALLEAARTVGQALNITIVPSAPPRGATSRDPIENIARASAVRVRRVALRKNWWRQDGGPMVGYLSDGKQPVALIPKGPRGYELWDPDARNRRRVTAGVADLLSDTAHCFYRPFPAEKLNFAKLLWFGVKGLERDAGVILITATLAGVLGLITPIASGILFDTIIPSTDRSQLWQMFGILLAAAVSTWLLRLVQNFALLRVEGKMDASLQSALWDRLLSLPVGFYRAYTAGDLAQRSLAISAMREIVTGSALSAMLTGVFSIFSVGLMFHYGFDLALPATGLIVISFLVTVLSAMLQIRFQRRYIEMAGRVAGLLPQLLGGLAKLRVAKAEGRAFARWAIRFAEQKRLSVNSRRITILLNIFFPLFQAATMMILFTFLARPESGSTGKAALTTGGFLAFQAAFFQVLAGASQLGSALVSVLGVVPMYERAKPILESLPEVNTSKSDPGDLTGDVELAHVAFRYRTDLPAVLKDVSLHIRAGQFAAIVGGTGSGKSTMFRMLLGFDMPESGSIFYDGQDLAGLDIQNVRKQIGVVLQQSGVMGGDLYSNIVGSSPLTMDDAWEAARMAGLEEDIRNMPMGMHTVIPDGGLGLSGGQRQRLQIARAVVNRPRLILFDEATSALDNQTQAVVMESLSRLKATRIVIAHRLSTIRDADCIFVLNQGVIAESGTYDELMAHNGFFAELARRQLA